MDESVLNTSLITVYRNASTLARSSNLCAKTCNVEMRSSLRNRVMWGISSVESLCP
jgi:hypothetical protein